MAKPISMNICTIMRAIQQRVWIAFGATVVGTIAGALGGYLLGRATTLSQMEARLIQYSNRMLSEGDAGTAESRKVLAEINASPYAFCSDDEVAYLRGLVFRAEYLKDAGRMRDGRIECSATLSHVPVSQLQLRPDFMQTDGTVLYEDLPMFRIGNRSAITVQSGDSYIVYNPYNPTPPISAPMHYTLTDTDVATRTTGRLMGEMPQVPQTILRTEGLTRYNGSIYATRCTSDQAVCATTYVAIPEAILTNHTALSISVLMGALAGGLLGFICYLIYGRNQGMEHRLLRAIRRDELKVVYQPIVDLATGEIVEAEALVRWTDDDNNPISPEVFIKVAENAGFVGEVTRLVVRRVLHDFGKTLRERSGFRVNVNIAAPDLADPEFMPMLENALSKAGVQPNGLGIEITESFTARQQVAKETILRLRQKGHFVHIDDFGTGYSSLAYLHDLSVDAIKIDKAFTRAIGTDAVTGSILPQILTMADTLELRVIVEGIETLQQAAYFAAADQIIYAQGWLYGHPVPSESFHRQLAEKTAGSGSVVPIDQKGAVASAFSA
jgi:sensor c-di-GMP phosphodiesterase-like protein